MHLTYQQYLALKGETELKHEFLNGEAWAMVGGTYRHSAVIMNLSGLLFNRLRGGPCRAFTSDAKGSPGIPMAAGG